MRSALNLTVMSYAGEARPGMSRRFSGGRLTMGRANDNDWMLPDPAKHVSSHHCFIEQQDNRYLITDISRNGVFLNGVDTPLGNGRSSALTHGDLVTVGDYLIRVEIEGLPQAVTPTPVPEAGPLNPFGAGSGREEGPFARRDVPPPAGFQLAAPSIDHAAPGFPPFDPQPARFPASLPQAAFANPADDGGRRGRPDADHVPAIDTFFRAPEVREPIIPPDWNASPEPAGASAAPAISPGRNDRPVVAPAMPDTPAPLMEKPAAAAVAPVAAAASADAGATATALLRAFLGGAGLPDVAVNAEDAAERMRRYGEIFRELVAGIRDLLATRALMKSEFRLDQTTIRPSDNNPLKFSVDLEQALGALLLPQRSGYAEPLPATRQAIADLRAHEIALIAGMQAAVTKLLAGLAPAEVEQRIEAAGLLASVLPAARKARYWEAYEKIYRQISDELREDVQGVFRQSFAEAYFEQVKKL